MAAESAAPLFKPEILAPAGDVDCFLAALAAGADAIYLGLKNFSARMEAENFGLGELARLLDLAHIRNCRVYVAMNSLLKQPELAQAWRLLKRLSAQARPDGLIIQDLAFLDLIRQAEYAGTITLSTLANITSPSGLAEAARLGADRIVLPRELSLDEIRMMGEACPPNLELECFVQGALCYCVSGRCYWSSYMGGKSGLRGRCVQPCRRVYGRMSPGKSEKEARGGGRFFSCQDLELGGVARTLLSVPKVASWKIEGRKKGPHYVFYTVTAYRLIADNPDDPQARKMAGELLEMALGRSGVKARFLPQKQYQPMRPELGAVSGRLAGKIHIGQNGECVLKPHYELLPKDNLRIGVEDEKWHATMPVTRRTPKGGALNLRLPKHKTPKAGTPVFLIDRREPALVERLDALRKELNAIKAPHIANVEGSPRLPAGPVKKNLPDMLTRFSSGDQRQKAREKEKSFRAAQALWLAPHPPRLSPTVYKKIFFWLPPVIWPENENAYRKNIFILWRGGARNFVANAPWQRALFPENPPEDANLIAGPFCNLANGLAMAEMAKLGFTAAFASPELSGEDLLALPAASPLPLGLTLGGNWPAGLSRFGTLGINANEPFASPMGEAFWTKDHWGLTWIYPGWPLNLEDKKKDLLKAGYSFFAWLEDSKPAALNARKREGLFNWDCGLM